MEALHTETTKFFPSSSTYELLTVGSQEATVLWECAQREEMATMVLRSHAHERPCRGDVGTFKSHAAAEFTREDDEQK